LPVLISSCLLGIACRYDGAHSRVAELVAKAQDLHLIPICPEQLGGLPTPRSPVTILNGDGRAVLAGQGRVMNSSGQDVTAAFLKGARETLRLAEITGAATALLKDKSPSCGLATPYCETDKGYGLGVTAALLTSAGIRVIEIDPQNIKKGFIEELGFL
jgi:uncharacterized protein YbbK (DUF523 family)